MMNKSKKINLEKMIKDEPVQKYGWKKHLRDATIEFTIMSNIIYGIFAYGLSSEGNSKKDIDSAACIKFYDTKKAEYVPIKGLLYYVGLPGREAGYYLYNKFPNAFPQDSTN